MIPIPFGPLPTDNIGWLIFGLENGAIGTVLYRIVRFLARRKK